VFNLLPALEETERVGGGGVGELGKGGFGVYGVGDGGKGNEGMEVDKKPGEDVNFDRSNYYLNNNRRPFTEITNDQMLVIYLSSLIRTVIKLHDLINNKAS
jgi:hypothetical protein